MSEEEFWRSTPRKVGKLWELHVKFKGWKVKDNKETVKAKKVFIDEIPFL